MQLDELNETTCRSFYADGDDSPNGSLLCFANLEDEKVEDYELAGGTCDGW